MLSTGLIYVTGAQQWRLITQCSTYLLLTAGIPAPIERIVFLLVTISIGREVNHVCSTLGFHSLVDRKMVCFDTPKFRQLSLSRQISVQGTSESSSLTASSLFLAYKFSWKYF